MSSVLLATAALHAHSCDANLSLGPLCLFLLVLLETGELRDWAKLSFRLWLDVPMLTVGTTASLCVKSLKFSEVNEELRSPLDALLCLLSLFFWNVFKKKSDWWCFESNLAFWQKICTISPNNLSQMTYINPSDSYFKLPFSVLNIFIDLSCAALSRWWWWWWWGWPCVLLPWWDQHHGQRPDVCRVLPNEQPSVFIMP